MRALGKTTVARLIANIYYSLGYIKKNKVVEVQSQDLIGEWLGQTGPKTQNVIDSAIDGVLFIDEAYELSGKPTICIECISVLLDVLETHRDSLTVILAGYEKPMREFLQKNQGLQSRFPTMIRFENYNPDELTEIFCQIASKYGFTISERGIQKFNRIMLTEMQSEFFGNGRTVRTVFEQSFRQHAVNLDANTGGSVKAFELDENDICLDTVE